MRPVSNQPARLYGTAKTYKFEDSQNKTEEDIKFRPIIDTIGTFPYNTAQVISDYLKSLCRSFPR